MYVCVNIAFCLLFCWWILTMGNFQL